MADTISPNQPLFTCLSCSIAFLSAEDQREHYRSDHHRYNMKRRVAGLPPVSLTTFNQKVLDRRIETSVQSSTRGASCEVCGKIYTTENAYRSHLSSKKHKENELKGPKVRPEGLAAQTPPVVPAESPPSESVPETETKSETAPSSDTSEEADQVTQSIEDKIAAARSRLSPLHCLFCIEQSTSLEENLTHMSNAHSFFIPDADYLVNLTGLISYLGEKIAVGNVCIHCNMRSREFRSLAAVRKHMVDKSHCKIAYDTEGDRLELSDYYDFTTSYPDANGDRVRRTAKAAQAGEWEDVDESGSDADEVVDDDDAEGDSDEDVPDSSITYGDTPLELVLPSGARIGHRSLRRYYAQSLRSTIPTSFEDPNSGAALVRRLLADKNSALVPRKGGFGAYGGGTDVIKARNRGEAREAGRHVREFRDQKRREDFKTRVAFIHNSQKHFRDPHHTLCGG
ncbi:hypothetical protein BDN72DRAFT_892261 [Pluteus cervinus]|uniref:Uncharacterized protein n=1 Tax=Pluteus cervinus TaxID=181527 RepID=A0ACD3BB50_9AGAR|nr:hypothetical protein BDN72DRAFT_892261 [Pluteus cervinus]